MAPSVMNLVVGKVSLVSKTYEKKLGVRSTIRDCKDWWNMRRSSVSDISQSQMTSQAIYIYVDRLESSLLFNMTEESLDQVVFRFYRTLGGPGAFQGLQKLKLALRAGGYRFSQMDIVNALSKIEGWSRFRTRYRTIPRHVPLRFGRVSETGLWLVGDSEW